jgi:hypothetical protein
MADVQHRHQNQSHPDLYHPQDFLLLNLWKNSRYQSLCCCTQVLLLPVLAVLSGDGAASPKQRQ